MLRLRFPLLAVLLLFAVSAYAAITGVISGTVTDSTGAVVPGVTVTALNQDTGVKQSAVTDGKGFYTFPVLDIGNYTVSASQSGFESFTEKDIHIDANSSVRTDIALKVGSTASTVEVTGNAVQVETQSTQLGEVISSDKMTAVPLNGRAFTDLLALQPGVSPYNATSESTNGPGGKVSGSLNAGNVSVNGGREGSNSYMVNGGDVNDGVENATAIIPNLDSISEFRIITDNFDAEYGNFSGGQVNVVTKNGTNQWHGSGFEFFRNQDLNARGYTFSPTVLAKGAYHQNIYGGTFGGPIKHDKVFFFADYQATNFSNAGTDSTWVPSAADLSGNVSDLAFSLIPNITKAGASPNYDYVNGTGWAAALSNRLGYTVTNGETYYNPPAGNSATFQPACTNHVAGDPNGCVFPGGVIPTSAWDPVPSHLLKYIPAANGTVGNSNAPGGTQQGFVTNSAASTTKDAKEGLRVDVNTHYGVFFVYYFLDNDTVLSPFGGGTAPGFPTSNTTRAQLYNTGLTTTFRNNSVNTLRLTYMRSAWHSSTPEFTEPGPSLASLGFVTPWGPTGGISPVVPGLEGVPQININGLSFGTPNATDGHFDNTYQVLDTYMKVVGTHTITFGASYHFDEIDERNYTGENGVSSFSDASETGAGWADFLLGADSGDFTQSSVQILDDRSYYLAGFAEDSWRARPNLTLNYGLRYEISTPWWDRDNKIESIVPGLQSVVFPQSPMGWVFPGDPGVPKTLAPIKYDKFAPRFGFAFAPTTSDKGFLGRLLGGPGMFSLRGGAGIFNTNYQEESGYQEAGDTPYGAYYQAGSPMILSQPYVNRYSNNLVGTAGSVQSQPFPFNWPPKNVSAKNPFVGYDFPAAFPISESFAVGTHNTIPYLMEYNLGIQRQMGRNSVFTLNYVGSQGRHLANAIESNPGNPALCLSYNSTTLAAGQKACGHGAENQAYTLKSGQVVPGTSAMNVQDNIVTSQGAVPFGTNPIQQTEGTSNFNSMQTNFKHTSKYWDVLIGYTYGRSFDNSSGLDDGTYVYNPRLSYSLSKFNVSSYAVASYNLHLPFANWVSNRGAKAIVGGWSISGISKFATGTPISLSQKGDLSLTGINQGDVPNYVPGNGSLKGDHNPRDRNPAKPTSGLPWFNPALFTSETTGVYGNAKRRFMTGPGLDHTDVAVAREFHIRERNVIQLRFEAFNFLNHTEFSNPSGSYVTTGAFGLVSGTNGGQRIMQAAVKYHF